MLFKKSNSFIIIIVLTNSNLLKCLHVYNLANLYSHKIRQNVRHANISTITVNSQMHSFDVDMGENFSIHESEWFEHGNNTLAFETGTLYSFK